jgi:hypothetical protein
MNGARRLMLYLPVKLTGRVYDPSGSLVEIRFGSETGWINRWELKSVVSGGSGGIGPADAKNIDNQLGKARVKLAEKGVSFFADGAGA